MAANAYLRVIHLSPDAPDVNIVIDEKKIIKDIGYTDSSGYVELEPGEHTIILTNTEGDPLLDPVKINLDSGSYHTIVASGLSKRKPKLNLVLYSDAPTGMAA